MWGRGGRGRPWRNPPRWSGPGPSVVGVNLLPPGVNRLILASETRLTGFTRLAVRLTAPPPTCPDCGRPLPADGGPCSFCTLTAAEIATPAPDTGPGLVAGRYLLQRRLGRGGAKDVWLAHDLTLDRGVALARVSGPDAWERLRREARLTARLGGHRHIVTVHDVFDDEGTPCLVARYMTGGSLSDRLERAPGGRLQPQEAIRAGREIAAALAHAHANGVVHRDVKPDNIWIDAEGEAALGDFGVAMADGEHRSVGRDAALRGAGAAHRRPRQRAHRPVLARHHDLRAAHGPAAVRADRPVPDAPAGAALEPRARDPRARSTRSCCRCSPTTRATGPPTPTSSPPRLAESGRLGAPRGRDRARARARAPARRAHAGVERRRAHDRRRRRAGNRQDHAARRARRRGRPARRRRAVGPRRSRGPRLRRVALGAARAARRAGRGARAGCSAATASPGGEQDRLKLFDAVADGAGGARRPTSRCSSILDDLHWADASSLRLLAHVVDAEPGARLLIACSSRTRRSRSARDTRRADRAHARRGARADARRAARRDARDRPRAHRRQPVLRRRARRGCSRRARRAFPRACARSCARRVEQLGRRDRRRCSRPAPSPAASRSPTSCAPSGVPRAAVAAAVERGESRGHDRRRPEAPGHFAFAHAIVRDAIRDALPGPRRAALHEAVADALRVRRDAGADVSAARIAHHALAAARIGADPQPAWDAALEAAREARVGARPRRGRAPLRRGARRARAGRRGAGGGAARDAARARRRDVRGRATSRRPAGATRRPRPRRRRERDAEALARAALGFSQVYPYGAVDTEGMTLLTEAREALADGAAAGAGDRPAGGLRAGAGAARGADRRGARGRARRGDARLAVPGGGDRQLAPGARGRSAPPRPRRSCAPRPSTPTTARWCGRTCTASTTRSRPATSRAPTPTSTARAPVAHATRRTHTRWVMLVAEAGPGGVRGPARRGRPADRGGAGAQPPPRRRLLPGAHGRAARAGAAAVAPARGRPRPAARLRRALPAPAGVGGDAGGARVGARQRRGRPSRRRGLRARRLRRGRELARLPARRPLPRRPDGRRRRAAAGRAALRAAAPARDRQPGADVPVGRLGARWRAASGCWPRPTTGPRDAAEHFARRAAAVRRAGRARRGRCGRSATGSTPASPCRTAPTSSTAGYTLANELGLPGVAARIADKAQTITP